MRTIRIFDTTLRDGEQSAGINLNVQEKLEIAQQLARLKVDVIEAGFAIVSPGDFAGVKAIADNVKDVTVCSLARAVPGDIERAWEALKDAEQPLIHTFIATSDIHMQHKLRKKPGRGRGDGRGRGQTGPQSLPGGRILGRGRHAERLGFPLPDLCRDHRGRGDGHQRAGHRGLHQPD